MTPRLACLCATALLAAACGDPAVPAAGPRNFAVAVSAQTDDGRPLADVRVSRGETVLGTTGADGAATLSITGATGDVVPLSAECPEGFRAAEAAASITLHELRELGGGGQRELEYPVQCRPSERLIAIVIRADGGPGLPVLVDGAPSTTTDARGAAHLGLTLPPGQTVRLRLDTEGDDELRPRSPELLVAVPDKDELFVFDQSFERVVRKKPRRRKRKPRKPEPAAEEPPKPKRPVRIE